jgi:hypothetical protein
VTCEDAMAGIAPRAASQFVGRLFDFWQFV